jgi:hypothetical protein
MANDLVEPEIRERLFSVAMSWLTMAQEFEREASEHEEMLKCLRRHLAVIAITPTVH